MLLGVLISMTVFSSIFYETYGKLAENQIRKIKDLEKEIALQSGRQAAAA